MRIRGSSLPWITPNIKNLIRARDFHKKIRNINSQWYKAKKSYFCDKFENCAPTKEPKQSWHHINHLMGKNYKSNNIPQIKIGETIISDNLMLAEAFKDFFVSIGPNLSDEFDHVTSDLPENLATRPESLFILSEISEYKYITH